MKYIIEIEDEPFGRNDDPVIPHGMDELYRAKGFNSLVFDQFGLDKLKPLDEALEEAYQKGLHAGESKCEYCDEYKRGLDDVWKAITKIAKMPDGEREKVFGDWWISNILNNFSATEIINILDGYEPERDEIKVGDKVTAVCESAVVIRKYTGNGGRWIKLHTVFGNEPVMIQVENISCYRHLGDRTVVQFVGGTNDNYLDVVETPVEIRELIKGVTT